MRSDLFVCFVFLLTFIVFALISLICRLFTSGMWQQKQKAAVYTQTMLNGTKMFIPSKIRRVTALLNTPQVLEKNLSGRAELPWSPPAGLVGSVSSGSLKETPMFLMWRPPTERWARSWIPHAWMCVLLFWFTNNIKYTNRVKWSATVSVSSTYKIKIRFHVRNRKLKQQYLNFWFVLNSSTCFQLKYNTNYNIVNCGLI